MRCDQDAEGGRKDRGRLGYRRRSLWAFVQSLKCRLRRDPASRPHGGLARSPARWYKPKNERDDNPDFDAWLADPSVRHPKVREEPSRRRTEHQTHGHTARTLCSSWVMCGRPLPICDRCRRRLAKAQVLKSPTRRALSAGLRAPALRQPKPGSAASTAPV